MTDRCRQYKRVLHRARSLGMPDRQIAECIAALRDGTTPSELDVVLARESILGPVDLIAGPSTSETATPDSVTAS